MKMNDPSFEGAGKRAHPAAALLEEVVRRKLTERREALGLSEEALGARTFEQLGWSDGQKKANNLLRGQTRMLLSDFYILCEGLGLHPDRVFTICLVEALERVSGAGEAN